MEPRQPKSLKQITLIAVDGRPEIFNTEMAHKALIYSQRNLIFGAVKLLTPLEPKHIDPRIEQVKIDPIESYDGYSHFIFKNLVDYVDTDFCLLVQADGFVTNSSAWDIGFLEYDYIGAPWPDTTAQRAGADFTVYDISQQGRVGNGGFSLRSRRLLEACAALNYEVFGHLPEDFVICRLLRTYLTDRGIRFAPLDLAARFSLELPVRDIPFNIDQSFGFHGRHFEPERLLMSLDV
jgi:hypothetical protein